MFIKCLSWRGVTPSPPLLPSSPSLSLLIRGFHWQHLSMCGRKKDTRIIIIRKYPEGLCGCGDLGEFSPRAAFYFCPDQGPVHLWSEGHLIYATYTYSLAGRIKLSKPIFKSQSAPRNIKWLFCQRHDVEKYRGLSRCCSPVVVWLIDLDRAVRGFSYLRT